MPPFVILSGNPAAVHGLNLEGLKRRGFNRDQINGIRHAYKLLYKSGHTLEEAKQAMQEAKANYPEAQGNIQQFCDFLDKSTRGIVR